MVTLTPSNWHTCWRKLRVVSLATLFLFLGYTGVAVMRSPYYLTYREVPADVAYRDSPPEGVAATQGGYTPLVVLLLSSMPRGGSTLVAELLTAMPGAVMFFEPLWNIEKTDCYQDEACVQRYLADVFTCTFKDDFEEWLKGKAMFFNYFSQEARRCGQLQGEARKECHRAMDLRSLCAAAPVVVVKVVRARVAWLHNILEDSLINLKVVHLTRDPRGSLNSIKRFGWNRDPHSRCSGLLDDLLAYDRLQPLFPDKVMQMHYEQLCLEPERGAHQLFTFLFGPAATLPPPVAAFLTQHMLTNTTVKGSMSTVKNSTNEYQAWRLKINGDYLRDIEAEPTCSRALRHLGHALFGSLDAALDLARPLFTNDTT